MRVQRLLPVLGLSAGVAVASAAAVPAVATAQTAAAQAAIQIGVPIEGALDTSDDAGDRGFADNYTFQASAGQSVLIQMGSASFDTYLEVYDANGTRIAYDDDGGDGTNSTMIFTAPSAGPYTIAATSYSSGTTGAYTLSVDDFMPQPLAEQPIALGDEVLGTLDSADAYLEGYGYAESYRIEANRGDTFVFRVASDLSVFAYIVGPSGEPISDLYSGLPVSTFTAETTGTYRAVVTSYMGFSPATYSATLSQPGEDATAVALTLGEAVVDELTASGERRFSLALDAGDQLFVSMSSEDFDSYLTLRGPDGQDIAYDDDSGEGLNSALAFAVPSAGTYSIVASSYSGSAGTFTLVAELDEPVVVVPSEIAIGETVSGSLGRGDARSQSGGYVDTYVFDGVAGQQIEATLGQNYETQVAIVSPTGEQLYGDMYGLGSSARALVTLPVSGRFMVLVSSYSSTAADYELSVMEASLANRVTEPAAINTVIEATLDDSDARHPRGGAVDYYAITVAEAGTYRFAMRSEETDGYLELYDANDILLASNDDTDNLNPVIRMFLAEGEYVVAATEFSVAGGAYTFEARALPDVVAAPQTVAIGDVVQGVIAEDDAYSATRGAPADFFRIELGAGQSLTAELTSDAFDAYLLIVGPTGQVLMQDDDGAGALNSRASISAPRSGLYTIIATTWDSGGGEYTLSITDASPTPTAWK